MKSIKNTFSTLTLPLNNNCDFCLIEHSKNVFVGVDNDNNVSVVVSSIEKKGDGVKTRTNLVSIETFLELSYKITDMEKYGVFHVVRCFSKEKAEINVFLDLCDAFFARGTLKASEIYDVFMILSDFFSKKRTFSYEELQGLYSELYTIYYFRDKINLGHYWRSRNNLKFDFSITSNIKLEIKSTTKENRIHSFNHEQLATKLYDVYVLSYKLRFDDKGLSLVELIEKVLPLLDYYPKKKVMLYKVLKEAGNELLENVIYNIEYTNYNIKLYEAKNVPHFEDVEGVTNAYYNSNFENINSSNIDEFIKKCCKEG